MKKAPSFSLLAALLLASPLPAEAQGFKDVVRYAGGSALTNTWENCVRTKWDAPSEGCGSIAAASISAPQIGSAISNDLLMVYFGFNSAELTPAASGKLDSLSTLLKQAEGVENVDIVGYADALGDPEYNIALSQKRARAVEAYLASRGYLQTRAVSVRGIGENAPVSECGGVSGQELRACLWRDRRVEIKLNYKR